eukprot:178279-Prymnesium_polylepis.1
MVRVVTPDESALTCGGPHPAAPGGEDAPCWQACRALVCRRRRSRTRAVMSRIVDTKTVYSSRYGA